jgi:hypothetical protein
MVEMDEDLKNELLQILREMKTGAPGAWQTLVEQRAAYCWATTIQGLAVAVSGIVAASVLLPRFVRRIMHDDEAVFVPAIVGTVITSALSLSAVISGTIAAGTHFPEAMAPLGRVLEMLR